MPDKVVDVYIGFMDEEVNARLKAVIDQELGKNETERRPVILIERNKIGPDDPILQWPRYRYPCGILRTMSVSPTLAPDSWPAGSSPDQILARAILVFMEAGREPVQQGAVVPVKRYFYLQELLNHSISERRKTPYGNDGPWLSVIRFDVGRQTNPPIIVIRSPEMGLQPGLISYWLEFLLRMLSPLSNQLASAAGDKEEWPIRLSCFGAQGATQGSKQPGSITDICASLFVGVEYHDGRPSSVIKLQTFQRAYTFFQAPGSANAELARAQFARGTELTTICEAEESWAHWGKREPDKIKQKGTPLAEVIQEVKIAYGKEVSMTASFFIGQDDKAMAGKLGLDSCGMEDSHVIQVLRRCADKWHQWEDFYPRLDTGSAFLTRVNCDPHTIDAAVAEAFQRVIQKPWLTADDYAELILWGLQGVLKTEIPACAAWRIVKEPVFDGRPELLQRQLYSFATDNGTVVADPFCVEIATDFLADLAGKQALVGREVPAGVVKRARELQEGWRLKEPLDTIRKRAAALVKQLVSDCDFSTGEAGRLKTWLRPNKWDGIKQSNTLEDLATKGEQFEHAAIDRAFYKSSNIMALQALAGRGLL